MSSRVVDKVKIELGIIAHMSVVRSDASFKISAIKGIFLVAHNTAGRA